MISSRSVNHPLGRNQVLVCVGEGGMRKKVARPIVRVISPLEKPGQWLSSCEIKDHLLNKKKPSMRRLYCQTVREDDGTHFLPPSGTTEDASHM